MDGYQSDSSEASSNTYTETNVLLGYASKEASEDITSYLGGRPTWLDPTTPPSANLAKCKVCQDFMVLLLQLNGDLPDVFPGHGRRLYVLGCRRKLCRRKEGCVRAIRGTRHTGVGKKKERREQSKPVNGNEERKNEGPGIGEQLFGASAMGKGSGGNPFAINGIGNPFSNSTGSGKMENPSGLPKKEDVPRATPKEEEVDDLSSLPKTFASALTLNLPPSPPSAAPEPWPSDSAFPPLYPVSYLSEAEYEVLDAPPAPVSIPHKGSLDLDDSPVPGGKEDKEVFESSLDKTFQRFADRLAQNPEQCIRYEFGGDVLLCSKIDVVGKLLSHSHDGSARESNEKGTKGMPRCGNCGSERKFEVQIMPHAIMVLEEEEEGMDGMEWGTVVVGVCGSDCQERAKQEGETGYLEEWVGVQWEETK